MVGQGGTENDCEQRWPDIRTYHIRDMLPRLDEHGARVYFK